MGLLYPELLLLAVPSLALWWWVRQHRWGQALRGALLLVLLVAIAGPYLQRFSKGQDVVVVIDASHSMPEGATARATELIQLLEDQRGPGDRVAVVRFGSNPALERALSEDARFSGFARTVSADGSNLAAALEVATGLIPDGREGRVLLISDGEFNGGTARAAAQRAAARNIPIHTRVLRRPAEEDLSIAQLDLPDFVPSGAPYQFSAWVHATTAMTTTYVLERDGVEISQGERSFQAGMNQIVFRDIQDHGGVVTYTLRLEGRDRITENNTGIGTVSVTGPRAVLVLTSDGQPSALSRTLRQSGMSVTEQSPEAADLSSVGLTRYRAVILENIAASRLGTEMPSLADFVHRSGGGLLMTGGQSSFGIGGYHESPLDEVLPVSMEMRQEHRKLGMALSIVLDRSGSMSMPVDGGHTKMSLANQGAAAAIGLLSPIDSVSVLAVDTNPHTVITQTTISDPQALTRRVRSIESTGGGIYTRVGLQAAQAQLQRAEQQNRHVILFADASDAEQQEGVPALLQSMQAEGMTTSVIALGTEQDSDARFLIDVARQGGGSAYFTTRAEDLPRLFAMDTLIMSKSTFIEEPTGTQVRPGLRGLMAWEGTQTPSLGGYNQTYIRPNASIGIITTDEFAAPVFAFQQHGLGRTAAFTGQIGGTYGPGVLQWPDFSRFFVSVVQALAAADPPGRWFADTRVEGQEAVISVEGPGDAPLVAQLYTADGQSIDIPMTQVSEGRWEVRHNLDVSGVTLGSVQVGEDQLLQLPAMALPYSPEYAYTADPHHGERRMREIAAMTGGINGGNISAILESSNAGVSGRLIVRELAVLALLLLLVEIAMRRLQLWGSLPAMPALPRLPRLPQRPARARSPSTSVPDPAVAAEPPAPTEDAPSNADTDEAGMSAALRAARENANRKFRR